MIKKTIFQFFDLFSNTSYSDSNKKKRVYVIGNGWSSYYFVKNLDKNKYEPIIISPNEKVLNTPKLIEYIVEDLDKNKNKKKVQIEFSNPYAKIIQDKLTHIDTHTKTIITESGNKYDYTHLVLAIGSESNDFGIEGVESYTYKLKTLNDANILKKRLSNLEVFTRIYIVGGGVSGIELSCWLSNQIQKYGSHPDIKIIEGCKSILQSYSAKTRSDIEKLLFCKYSTQIELFTDSMLKLINKTNIKYQKHNRIQNFPFSYIPKSNISSDLIIWTGGIRISGYKKTSLYEELEKISQTNSLKIGPRGLETNNDFSVIKNEIYSIGDMVSNKGPPTAQNAKFQGIWLAKYFNSNFEPKYIESNPYNYESYELGKLLHLDSELYLESKYYSGFIPKFLIYFIDWITQNK